MLIFTGGGRQNPNLDQKRRNKFRYGLIYFFFLAVGVPFLGTAYTAGLDAMAYHLVQVLGQIVFQLIQLFYQHMLIILHGLNETVCIYQIRQ